MAAVVNVRSVGGKKNKKKIKKREILCLANSWKPGGRCVAGLLPDGSWIRPVTATGNGSLAPQMCMLDVGRPVRALDVVRVGVKRAEPRLHQPENWVITDKRWKFVDARDPSEVQDFLDGALTDEPELFGTTSNKVAWSRIQQRGTDSSLALVKAANPAFGWNPHKPSQRRARFVYRGFTYDLPITFEFDLLPTGEQEHLSASTWYFTISLGEPYEGGCFKLIAGAIEAPA